MNLLRSLDLDRQKIAAERTDIASRLAEAEKPPEEDRYRLKIRKAKGRLRLKSFWLASLYKNLSFSPRQVAGCDLAGFHVRLVEGIDPDN